MKKIMVMVGILLCMPFLVLGATSEYAPEGIMIDINGVDNQTSVLGRIDILVKRHEVQRNISDEPSETYVTMFGDIENIDYLKEDDTVWISYLAYVENANVLKYAEGMYLFASDEAEYMAYSTIKIVWIDQDKQTLYISDEITIEHPKPNEKRYGEIEFHAEVPYNVINYYTVGSWGIFISGLRWILIAAIALSVGVLTTTVIVIKVRARKR